LRRRSAESRRGFEILAERPGKNQASRNQHATNTLIQLFLISYFLFPLPRSSTYAVAALFITPRGHRQQ
jgi:hypothetical protein